MNSGTSLSTICALGYFIVALVLFAIAATVAFAGPTDS